jgi:hypothetical protein
LNKWQEIPVDMTESMAILLVQEGADAGLLLP